MMSTKAQILYRNIFQFIKTNLLDLTCGSFIVDYDTAIRNAIRMVYPAINLIGSWYHYHQNIKCYESTHSDFSKLIQTNVDAQQIFHKILCIPWLPFEHIMNMVESYKRYAFLIDKTIFQQFFDHFESQWMTEVREKEILISNIP